LLVAIDDVGYIAEQHRARGLLDDDQALQVVHVREGADRSNVQLLHAGVDRADGGRDIGGRERLGHLSDGEVVGGQAGVVHPDLDLPLQSARDGDAGDAQYRLQLWRDLVRRDVVQIVEWRPGEGDVHDGEAVGIGLLDGRRGDIRR